MAKEPGHPTGLTTFQSLTIASQFGVTLAVAVALGLFVGQWLDGLTGTGWVFTLIGVFLGFAAAISGTLTLYRAFVRRAQEEGRIARTRPSAHHGQR